MSPVFADTSALVKLYADEPDAGLVRALPLVVVSKLVRVEVPAALWRKHRLGELSATAAGILVAAFEADYFGTEDEPARLFVVPVTSPVLDLAAHLAGGHGLRAYDAVQLASACTVDSTVPDGARLVAFDKALRAAAAAEGLGLLPD